MLRIGSAAAHLCEGFSRRELLRVGALGLGGLTLPRLLQAQALAAPLPGGNSSASGGASGGKARSCIVLFLMGGPPQHSTWDPKPAAPAEVRGEFKPISTSVPGLQICELLPRTAQLAEHFAILRAVSTGDNAHSSSGYYMLTGQPHQPMNFENANPGAPNNWPTLGALVNTLHVKRLHEQGLAVGDSPLPAAIRLPHRIFNTDGSVWPGQDAGFLGRSADPWLFHCEPAAAGFRVPEFSLQTDLSLDRLASRRSLLDDLNRRAGQLDRSGVLGQYDAKTQQAIDVLTSPRSQKAFRLDEEGDAARDRYGRTQFGQSVLLARRLVEAGVSLVQVNWFRGADEPPDAPCWDSHAREAARLKQNLAPPFDLAYSALLADLKERGLLDETLVVCVSEFGRSPRMTGSGRGHWGSVFSATMAGGGVRGGQTYGASDAIGGQPKEGLVTPPDLIATVFHCLGYDPKTELHDPLGRPFPACRGEVVPPLLG
jgi:Protein of unknown function (DUF1501)